MIKESFERIVMKFTLKLINFILTLIWWEASGIGARTQFGLYQDQL